MSGNGLDRAKLIAKGIKSICTSTTTTEYDEFVVGKTYGFVPVTKITEWTENLGTYGIRWYSVMSNDQLMAEVNAAHVQTVRYFIDE